VCVCVCVSVRECVSVVVQCLFARSIINRFQSLIRSAALEFCPSLLIKKYFNKNQIKDESGTGHTGIHASRPGAGHPRVGPGPRPLGPLPRREGPRAPTVLHQTSAHRQCLP
jgi:hypothetical protein